MRPIRSEFEAQQSMQRAAPTWTIPAPIRAPRTVRAVPVFVRLFRYVLTQH
jgi:hypothetical protein